jgi:hypothetical protein
VEVMDKVRVDWRALIAWNALPASERSQVHETLSALANQPVAQWSDAGVQHLNSADAL